jgi:hypothetical protein
VKGVSSGTSGESKVNSPASSTDGERSTLHKLRTLSHAGGFRGVRDEGGAHRDATARSDSQLPVRALENGEGDLVAEVVRVPMQGCGRRLEVKLVREPHLPPQLPWREPQQMMRHGHR